MKKFNIVNLDQMNTYNHTVYAENEKEAKEKFYAGHYGSILRCEEVKENLTGTIITTMSSNNVIEFITIARGTCHNEDSARVIVLSNGVTVAHLSERQIKELSKLIL